MSTPTPQQFAELHDTPEFASLRTRFRSFAFPVTIAFLAWYLVYIVVATFATDFVETRIAGFINVGMVLGLAQFVTAGLITYFYIRFADNKIDPATHELRTMAESLAATPAPKEAVA